MRKILGLFIAVLVISVTASMVFAREAEVGDDRGNVAKNNDSAKGLAMKLQDREIIKSALKTQFSPVIHGYGIGFTDGSYITAKWQFVNVKTLSMDSIKDIVSKSNSTSWSDLKEELKTKLRASETVVSKGRLRIGRTDYILTNIQISNSTASADIRKMPDYDSCKQSNTSAEICESNSEKFGEMSLTKQTQAIEDESNAKVWAGTLSLNSTSYTFVTFAYPRVG
jgi:hypothetical protein